MKVKNLRQFQPENAPKAFGGRSLPGPAGGTYSAPQTPWLDLTSRGTDKGIGGKRQEGRGEGKKR